MRLGIGLAGALTVSTEGRKVCALCNHSETGRAHILALCPAVASDRHTFLAKLDERFAATLQSAPAGDWPSIVLSPHLDLNKLKGAVVYCSAIMDKLKLCKS